MTSEHDSVSVDATSFRAHGEVLDILSNHLSANAEGQSEPIGMVGDRMFRRESTRKSGRSPVIGDGGITPASTGEVRASIRAEMLGNASGAKGGMKRKLMEIRNAYTIQHIAKARSLETNRVQCELWKSIAYT